MIPLDIQLEFNFLQTSLKQEGKQIRVVNYLNKQTKKAHQNRNITLEVIEIEHLIESCDYLWKGGRRMNWRRT